MGEKKIAICSSIRMTLKQQYNWSQYTHRSSFLKALKAKMSLKLKVILTRTKLMVRQMGLQNWEVPIKVV